MTKKKAKAAPSFDQLIPWKSSSNFDCDVIESAVATIRGFYDVTGTYNSISGQSADFITMRR